MDVSHMRERDGEEENPQKRRPKTIRAALLATLHGAAGNSPDERWSRNRRDWNRYLAAALAKETRGRLIQEKRHPEEE